MKKKVLILIPSLMLGGGAERVASSMSRKLSRRYEITVLTFYHYKNLYPYGGSYYSLDVNQNSMKKYLIPLKLYDYIKLITPNVIISFMDHANIPLILTSLLFRLKIPLIMSVRINPQLAYKETRKYYRFLIPILYNLRRVSKIVTNSKGIQKILINIFKIKRDKTLTIHNGIDVDTIKELSKNKISHHSEIFRDENLIKFITVGRLSASKNQKLLIESFSQLHQEIKNSILIIIGEGPLKNELKALVKQHKLEESILFLGLKRNPFKYLAKSDIFVLSSNYEGLPNVLLEALACKLPVIATNLKGSNEILANGQYGILIDPKNKAELKEKMITMAKNEDLRQIFSRKATIRADFFNDEIIMNKWINLIEKIT